MFIGLFLGDGAKQNLTLQIASHFKCLIAKGLKVHSNKYALANKRLTICPLVFQEYKFYPVYVCFPIVTSWLENHIWFTESKLPEIFTVFTVFAMGIRFWSQGRSWNQVLEALVIDSKQVYDFPTDVLYDLTTHTKTPNEPVWPFPNYLHLFLCITSLPYWTVSRALNC